MTQQPIGAAPDVSDLGTLLLAVRKDTAAALSGVADGDYAPLLVDSSGRLQVVAGGTVSVSQASTAGNFGAITVGTSATQIRAANTSRRSISIFNNGSVTVYVGYDNTVTVSNGMPIPPGGERELRVTSDVYGIAGTAGQDVRYISENAS